MMTIGIEGSAAGPKTGRAMALDVVPALMLAAAVGFIAAVAPVDLIERIVAVSRLPSLVSAASPPLGFTARVITVAGSSIVTLVAAWLLLRTVGGRPAPVKAEGPREPRLRPQDRHPDAPARRPFSAREALSTLSPEPSAPPIERAARPLEQRSIAELLSTLESRLCGGAGDDLEVERLQRGHG